MDVAVFFGRLDIAIEFGCFPDRASFALNDRVERLIVAILRRGYGIQPFLRHGTGLEDSVALALNVAMECCTVPQRSG